MAKRVDRPKGIVVTPRMLRAGALALSAAGDVSDYELVGSVYRAMAAVAPAPEPTRKVAPANFLEVMRLMQPGRRDD